MNRIRHIKFLLIPPLFLILLIPTLTMSAICPCCVPDEGANLHVGEEVSLIEVPLFDGTQLDLSTVSESRIAVLFWATWCPTCMRELSEMAKLIETFTSQDTFLLGVSMDYDADAAYKFIEEKNVKFPNTLMSFDLVDEFKSVIILPKLIILDNTGKVLLVSNPKNQKEIEAGLLDTSL